MSRKINLIYQEEQKIKEIENISIAEVNSIFSYSCELLICKYFNIFDNGIVDQALSSLIDKVRPKGQIILGLSNMHELCSDFIHKKLTNEQFFSKIKTIHNYFGIDDIISYINSTGVGSIVNIKSEKYITYITIIKK